MHGHPRRSPLPTVFVLVWRRPYLLGGVALCRRQAPHRMASTAQEVRAVGRSAHRAPAGSRRSQHPRGGSVLPSLKTPPPSHRVGDVCAQRRGFRSGHRNDLPPSQARRCRRGRCAGADSTRGKARPRDAATVRGVLDRHLAVDAKCNGGVSGVDGWGVVRSAVRFYLRSGWIRGVRARRSGGVRRHRSRCWSLAWVLGATCTADTTIGCFALCSEICKNRCPAPGWTPCERSWLSPGETCCTGDVCCGAGFTCVGGMCFPAQPASITATALAVMTARCVVRTTAASRPSGVVLVATAQVERRASDGRGQ